MSDRTEHDKTPEQEPELDTIWQLPDALWERMSKVLAVYDPPSRMGCPRIDQRVAINGLIYRIRTGCQWNYLPAEFGWGMSVYRTFRRWERLGIFDILWALLIECEEPGGVDGRWQVADGCLGKARGVPRRPTFTGWEARTASQKINTVVITGNTSTTTVPASGPMITTYTAAYIALDWPRVGFSDLPEPQTVPLFA